MSSNQIAFFIGLFGSMHCIGMCGPLAFAIPSFDIRWWRIIIDKIAYNAGRVITYSFLGLLIGLLGHQLWLTGLQQGVSVISGLLIIGAGFSRLIKVEISSSRLISAFLTPITQLISYALRHKAGHFAVGMLNGFLPCGFVYLALIGAVNTSSPFSSAWYMFWFGVGTFPLMLLATVGTGFIGPVFRRRINNAMPYLMVCLGCWFVLRGLGMDVPYLSPVKQVSGISVCH
ncbi:sulfite exporter TauE/SafE family protein [Mucilaginibacter sp. 22184]|uniref:sulfite exporter TauE/SafE family protein n=1 Tax=Mucilaginibacter sp. 22184 TaxID=3453887 RepID=UPI003F87ADAE